MSTAVVPASTVAAVYTEFNEENVGWNAIGAEFAAFRTERLVSVGALANSPA